jgi:hypothetical protein
MLYSMDCRPSNVSSFTFTSEANAVKICGMLHVSQTG